MLRGAEGGAYWGSGATSTMMMALYAVEMAKPVDYAQWSFDRRHEIVRAFAERVPAEVREAVRL